MVLSSCKKSEKCIIKSLNFKDKKLQLHLAEIGFFVGNHIEVLKFSSLKKTMLIKVLNSCFAIKTVMADNIEVENE